MIFTKEELICFNSMLDGTDIFGTHFHVPKNWGEKDVQNTVQSLHKKGFLDENKQPNKLFLLAAKMLEKYKKADRHIFWNNARIALDDKRVTVLAETGDNFDITRTDKALYLLGMKENIPALNNIDSVPTITEELLMEDWANNYNKDVVIEDFCTVQKIKDKNISQDIAFIYRINNVWHIYRPERKELITCGTSHVCQYLIDIFEIEAFEKLKEDKLWQQNL